MFGARTAARRYLDVVRPWCQGEWSRESFASPEATAERLDPTHTIFPIPERPMPGLFEQLLLGPRASRDLMSLIGWVSRFNAMLAALNRVPVSDKVARLEMTIGLHGVIGVRGGGTLHDAFRAAESALS